MNWTVRRSQLAGLFAAGLTALVAAPASAADGSISASYSISIAGIMVGRADAELRFKGNGYSMALRGFTSGMSRLVSDANTLMSSKGRVDGEHLLPAAFELETTENGQSARVTMIMNGGAIVDTEAIPGLVERPDRIPVGTRHKRGVLDPMSALVVALRRAGPVAGTTACDRTIQVFDGWQRFDVKLSFQRTRNVAGDSNTYSGQVIVCDARYVPVAGHRPDQESVQYMANNERLEVWLISVEGQPVMIPFQLLIGTAVGDLVIRMNRFTTESPSQRASNDPPGERLQPQ